MLRALRTGVFAFATALGVGAAAPADAANETFRFSGTGAWGNLMISDMCTTGGLDVSAFKNATKTTGSQQTSSLVITVSYWAYNSCTSTFTGGGAFLDAGSFQANLQSGSLDVTIPVFVQGPDGASDTTANVSVRWSATGTVNKGSSHFITRTPTGIQHSRFKGTNAQATVNATVTASGTSTSASGVGELTDSTSGSTTVTR